MFKRLALALLFASMPTLALAQGATPPAPVCDGSEMRHAEHARNIGRTLYVGTAAADLAAMLTIPRNPGGVGTARSHFAFMGATLPVALAGFFIASNASPGEKFWERVVARLKVGETRAADVRLCLHRPNVSSSGTTEEQWTYLTVRPSSLGRTVRTLRLTFRDSVLADVQRTEVDGDVGALTAFDPTGAWRHRGFCAPPIPVVANPFPTPTDTSAAAAAAARAQADADAASRNAAASAAYAVCLASDSAR